MNRAADTPERLPGGVERRRFAPAAAVRPREWSLLLLLPVLLACFRIAGPSPAHGQPPEPIRTAPPEAVALLRELEQPSLEPLLRWDWEPAAFNPLTHPIEYDFGWRLRELGRSDLPAVARARLNFELAFLNDAAARLGDPAHPDYRTGMPAVPWDPAGRDERLRTAIAGYRKLLAGEPEQGEFLTDLGDLFLLSGRPDSAAVLFRRAMNGPRPPARVFARAAHAELLVFSSAPDSMKLGPFRSIRSAGLAWFDRPAPADSILAARHLVEGARFRIEQSLVEFYADRMARPDVWSGAGIDSVFSLLARVVAPTTRRMLAEAANRDTTYAEAYGLLGTVVTGQILLPIAARSLLFRNQDVPADSLALALWVLARERGEQKLADLKYAAANLNRCEDLEPGRYPVVRREQARLALIFGDVDGAAGLYRALLARYPNQLSFAEELFTVYRLESASLESGARMRLPEARLEEVLDETVPKTGNGELTALLGWTRSASGRRSEADAAFASAAAQDSLAWRARLGLAVSALRELDAQKAEPHLKVAGDRFAAMDDPGKSVYCTAVGLLYLVRGDRTNSRMWLNEALGFDPRNGIAARAMRAAGAGG